MPFVTLPLMVACGGFRMSRTNRIWLASLIVAGCVTPSPGPLATTGDDPAAPVDTTEPALGSSESPGPALPSTSDQEALPSPAPSPGPTPSPSPTVYSGSGGGGGSSNPSPSPTPSSNAAASPSPTPTPSGSGAARYVAAISAAEGGELSDWQAVTGPGWLNSEPWTVTGGIWQLPTFSGHRWAFRRYAGDAFGSDGQMPDLYQFSVTVRPQTDAGQIVVVPYYKDPTTYQAVILNLSGKNVSIIEYVGGTPASGASGTYDLSQNHRGWQPLPAPNDDGSYTVRVKVNAQWHSLAVWVNNSWIDTPYVPAVDREPHWVAIRTNGTPQTVLSAEVLRYDDPMEAR